MNLKKSYSERSLSVIKSTASSMAEDFAKIFVAIPWGGDKA